MPNPITQVQPPLEFVPPNFSPPVWKIGQMILPSWMRWRVGIADYQVENTEQLVNLYQQFQAGKVRFLLAFRHPTSDDPFCLMRLLMDELPQVSRQMGVKLKPPTHVHFIYDRGIPLWAGKFVGWLFSHLGGIPVRRGKVDLVSLRSVRNLFANGQFPLAAAPEGGTNGHSELVSPLEPGIAQFGFWCAEDLRKGDRSEAVLILPLGIQYRFAEAPWRSLEQLLQALEVDSGINVTDVPALGLQNGIDPTPKQQTVLYQRLLGLGEHLLGLLEQFYNTFYQQTLNLPQPASIDAAAVPGDLSSTDDDQMATRLHALLNAALAVAEDFFNIPSKGTVTDRCRRLEQASWDRIFREDLKPIEQLSPVEKGLADRIAEEADLRVWHMRLVESFVSVTGHYVKEKPTAERFAETLLLLKDMVARLKGKSPTETAPDLGIRTVQLVVGGPISVSDRWDSYKANRRQAVATLTQDLQTALEAMIR